MGISSIRVADDEGYEYCKRTAQRTAPQPTVILVNLLLTNWISPVSQLEAARSPDQNAMYVKQGQFHRTADVLWGRICCESATHDFETTP